MIAGSALKPADELRAALRSDSVLVHSLESRNSGGRATSNSIGDPQFDNVFMEQCRVALHRLIGLADEGVIQVCSPRRNEGRSSVAAALAILLARTRGTGTVLLLDLDLDRGTQADLFAVAPAPGLADYLEGREQLRAVSDRDGDQLRLIPAGTHLGDRARPLHLMAEHDLLAVFRERFRWVVLDMPPVLGHPEAAVLANRVDFHLVVGRHRRTLVSELHKLLGMIGDNGQTGFLLTGDSSRMPRWMRRLL
jgi:Mrp family chromosome partitioning ATPase